MERLETLRGQWLGPYHGTNHGILRVDIDELEDHYAGSAYVLDEESNLPNTFATFTTQDKRTEQRLALPLINLDREGNRLFATRVARLPASAEVDLHLAKGILHVQATTDIGTSIIADLPRADETISSELVAERQVTSWDSFKANVISGNRGRHVYRGQRDPTKLVTSFHRSARYDLYRYRREDIAALHRHLTSRTKHFFNLSDPDELGAFINLAQHHGYPTPLLDWSFSPYVAAFFAFRRVNRSGQTGSVRIFMFDKEAWEKTFPPISDLGVIWPNLSFLDFIAIENDRLVPQQSLSSLANMVDIESWVRLVEKAIGRSFLMAFDIPKSERSYVMEDLRTMGITAGSLFPGLDGACEAMAEERFP
jgi:hypothetical protein